MKTIVFIFMFLFSVCFASAQELNLVMAKDAELVLAVSNDGNNKNMACDKYCWQEVKIRKILKNSGDYKLSEVITIASYSSDGGVPDGDSIVYLERYNPERKDLWKLVGGKARTGVSSIK